MKILITGASGFIGSELSEYFKIAGHQVFPMKRGDNRQKEPFFWSPDEGTIHFDKTKPIDVVINLAGENLSAGRWTKSRKDKLRNSRIQSTEILSKKIASLPQKPKLLISASAIGFYGYNTIQKVDENSPPGKGFLAELCRHWELSTRPAAESGIRTVNLRLGMVFSFKGGILGKLLPIFKFGFGGRIGDGKQMMSWIGLVEMGPIIDFIIAKENIYGPVNAVSPNPLTNNEFTRILGEKLKKPVRLIVPKFLLIQRFGEMARELILSSTHAIPQCLISNGYKFKIENFSDCADIYL
ncbi:MAG: TIGR01777 family oxidoreductase [Candidatus Marinimicrobia bacterium]|nr:TIGR01777 family oxidoreductase [Candidatus Neomarinimicrobiota bacterium]